MPGLADDLRSLTSVNNKPRANRILLQAAATIDSYTAEIKDLFMRSVQDLFAQLEAQAEQIPALKQQVADANKARDDAVKAKDDAVKALADSAIPPDLLAKADALLNQLQSA